eukprot:TRINITY_DN2056_c0_g1_i6.p2 TRINITY_DN2056_c0_g1~~TRINITY_DN2056_c0_g1_i6.p2  ORF type:complete len:373 (-),score=94.77 TRINITY_DN2056_c0_g1_i6:178-1296(-)
MAVDLSPYSAVSTQSTGRDLQPSKRESSQGRKMAGALSSLLEVVSDGEELTIDSDIYEPGLVEVSRAITIAGDDVEHLHTIEVLSLVIRPLGKCVLRNLRIKGAPGFLETLIHVSCSELEMVNCEIQGGHIGLLVVSGSKVVAERCHISACLYAGVSVDCGHITLQECCIEDPEVFGVVVSAQMTRQDESVAVLDQCTVLRHGPLRAAEAQQAGVAAIAGGWVVVQNGTRISGYVCGVFGSGARTVCHVRQAVQITENRVGMILTQNCTAHACAQTIVHNLQPDQVQVMPGCFCHQDDGLQAEAQERSLSRKIVMGVLKPGSAAVADLHRGLCGLGQTVGYDSMSAQNAAQSNRICGEFAGQEQTQPSRTCF